MKRPTTEPHFDAERQELNGAVHAAPAAKLNGSAAAIGHNSIPADIPPITADSPSSAAMAAAAPVALDARPDIQRDLLNRSLATWAWNKQFEDGQAEIAEHLANAYTQALEPLKPKQIANIRGMRRVLLLRNFTLAAVAKFCRLNPRADSRLAVLLWIAFFADNDDGFSLLPTRKMSKIFARSQQALVDGIVDLEKDRLVVAERKQGMPTKYWPNIPAILAELQPHIVWIANALDPSSPTAQVDLSTTAQADLTGPLKWNPPLNSLTKNSLEEGDAEASTPPLDLHPETDGQGVAKKNGVATELHAPPKRGRKPTERRTRIPEDFPTAEAIAWARNRFVVRDRQIVREAEAFRNYWLAEGKTKADWPATWRNWLLRSRQNYKERDPHGAPDTTSKADELEAALEKRRQQDREREEQ